MEKQGKTAMKVKIMPWIGISVLLFGGLFCSCDNLWMKKFINPLANDEPGRKPDNPFAHIDEPEDGSAANPFNVYDIATLQRVGKGTGEYEAWNLEANYKQTKDIDMTGVTGFQPIGEDANPFTGAYDGQNHTITGLTISGSRNYAGLFGYIGLGGVVKNVGLKDIIVSGSSFIGGAAGCNSGGTVQNCYVTGNVTGASYAGGLVGRNSNGIIENSYTACSVKGSSYIGGLAGQNAASSTVKSCYTAGNVGDNASSAFAGGLVGQNDNSKVEYCAALNQTITGSSSTTGRVAGSAGLSGLTGNYAREDMLINGSPAAANIGQTEIHGENVNTSTPGGGHNSQLFWENTMGWDFAAVWVWNNSTHLPNLKNMPLP